MIDPVCSAGFANGARIGPTGAMTGAMTVRTVARIEGCSAVAGAGY